MSRGLLSPKMSRGLYSATYLKEFLSQNFPHKNVSAQGGIFNLVPSNWFKFYTALSTLKNKIYFRCGNETISDQFHHFNIFIGPKVCIVPHIWGKKVYLGTGVCLSATPRHFWNFGRTCISCKVDHQMTSLVLPWIALLASSVGTELVSAIVSTISFSDRQTNRQTDIRTHRSDSRYTCGWCLLRDVRGA